MDMLTLARSFASLLLDSAAKGTALLLLAALATWLCRRSSAALRHSIWCLAMGGLLVLPVASWALPAWQIPILPPESLLPPVSEVAGLPMSIPESVSLRTLPTRMESIPPFQPGLPAKSPDQATVESEVSVPLFVDSMQAPVHRRNCCAAMEYDQVDLGSDRCWLVAGSRPLRRAAACRTVENGEVASDFSDSF
jgi:hypothetical protein